MQRRATNEVVINAEGVINAFMVQIVYQSALITPSLVAGVALPSRWTILKCGIFHKPATDWASLYA